jgi:hypothetical protein
MNDLIRSEETASDLSMELVELGRMSEETKGSVSGPVTEQSVLPVRLA